jgi:hypothetical protein
MRSLKVLAAAAVLASTAVTANAGGLAPLPAPTPVERILPAPEPAGGSINSGYIVLGLLAALVAASASF